MPQAMAVQQGQYALEASEQEFETKVNAKEDYADAVGQEAFEAAQARGMPYEWAVAEGQKAQDDAESHYEVVKAKEAYADSVAEQEYERVLAMGFSYEEAVQEGQYALEASEQEFETRVNEKEEYASAVG